MTYDMSDAIVPFISHFAVGLVQRVKGKGSKVIDSGVLISIEDRHALLTCGHVAEAYESLPEIGIIRFVPGGHQRRMLKLHDTQTHIVQSSKDWSQHDCDLAFTFLPPSSASSIAAQFVFLKVEQNRSKIEAGESPKVKYVDVMLGLVAEFSEEPFKERDNVISNMRGILHSGRIRNQENGLLTFEAMDYNLTLLPNDFGGMSGAGLWRIYYDEDEDGRPRPTERRLYGVASWQIDHTKIACQGWGRIEVALPHVLAKLR